MCSRRALAKAVPTREDSGIISGRSPEGEFQGVTVQRADNLRNRVFCSSCGASAPRRHGLVPLGWQELPDATGRMLALCPDCVRRSLWMIEARLDLDPGAGG